MKKLINVIVEKCDDCPYFSGYCEQDGRTPDFEIYLEDNIVCCDYPIPDWCPLETVKK